MLGSARRQNYGPLQDPLLVNFCHVQDVGIRLEPARPPILREVRRVDRVRHVAPQPRIESCGSRAIARRSSAARLKPAPYADPLADNARSPVVGN